MTSKIIFIPMPNSVKSRQQELEEQKARRYKKWYDALPPEKQQLTPEEVKHLKEIGSVDAQGNLTPLGELRLHQLSLLEWMVNHPRTKKA